MEIVEKIFDKLESVDDKLGNVAIEQRVLSEKFVALESKMDEGRKRNIEAQDGIKVQIESLLPKIDGKANESDCRSRYETLRVELKKHKKAIFLLFLIIAGGTVTTAMTPEGKGLLKHLLSLLLGML